MQRGHTTCSKPAASWPGVAVTRGSATSSPQTPVCAPPAPPASLPAQTPPAPSSASPPPRARWPPAAAPPLGHPAAAPAAAAVVPAAGPLLPAAAAARQTCRGGMASSSISRPSGMAAALLIMAAGAPAPCHAVRSPSLCSGCRLVDLLASIPSHTCTAWWHEAGRVGRPGAPGLCMATACGI